jgi:electron transfer flavoprotein beta subunit
MEIVVVVKMVPDPVEELEVSAEGTDLERSLLTLRLNEFDEHALEEALLLKERAGGRVTVLALDAPGVDEALYTALAKGADQAVKVVGALPEPPSSRATAAILARVLEGLPHDLVLAGVQANDDRDGQVGPLLAAARDLPHVSVVTAVAAEAPGAVTVRQEHAGGLQAELEVTLPAVLGIQAAEQPPRYAPVSRVRQVMKTARIQEAQAPAEPLPLASTVRRLARPEAGGRAEILEGSPEEVAARLHAILAERGLVKGA